MSDRTITIKNWYPHTFVIDPDDAGDPQAIDLRIKRFNVDAGKRFNEAWQANQQRPSTRAIFRKPDGDEQAKHSVKQEDDKEVDEFVVDDAEIRRRRIAEMTAEASAAFQQQERQDMADEYDFLAATVREYVSIAPGQRVQIEPEDGGETFVVKTGEDMVRAFGGNRLQLLRLASAVWAENNLTGKEKKDYRTRSASLSSWNTPGQEAPGPRPAATVGPAASAGSVASAAAMASNAPSPSGSTVM